MALATQWRSHRSGLASKWRSQRNGVRKEMEVTSQWPPQEVSASHGKNPPLPRQWERAGERAAAKAQRPECCRRNFKPNIRWPRRKYHRRRMAFVEAERRDRAFLVGRVEVQTAPFINATEGLMVCVRRKLDGGKSKKSPQDSMVLPRSICFAACDRTSRQDGKVCSPKLLTYSSRGLTSRSAK